VNRLGFDPARPAVRVRLFGLLVRIDIPFLLVAALIGATVGGLGGFLVGVPVVLLIILAHELGHAGAGQLFGLRPTIDLGWFGGLTTLEGLEALTRPRRLVIFAAGPIAGAVAGGLAYVLGNDRDGMPGDVARLAFSLGIVWGLANLVPILPLDGGHLLVDLLWGDRGRRIRIARLVSVTVGTMVTLAAAGLGQPILALLPAFFVYVNVVGLRTERRGTPLPQEFLELLQRLDAETAPEAEQRAREVLEGTPVQADASAAGDLLLASLLVQGKRQEARAVLASFSNTYVWPLLRDLAVLGDLGPTILEERLAEGPTDHEVRLAALQRSLLGEHDRVAAMMTSPLRHQLDDVTLFQAQARAHWAGAFAASACIGEAGAALPDAPPMVVYNIACALARQGESSAALDSLRKSAEAGFRDVELLDKDEDLAPLRSLEGYASARRIMRSGSASRRADAGRLPRSGAALGLAACSVLLAGLVVVLPSSEDGPRGLLASEVVGVDLRSGEVRWRQPFGAPYGLVSSGDGLIVVSTFRAGRNGSDTMTLRDPEDGRTLMKIPSAATLARLQDGLLLVQEPEVRLAAFEVGTGKERWSIEGDHYVSLLLEGVVVLPSSSDSGVQAVALDTGAVLWSRYDVWLLDEGARRDVVIASSPNGRRIMRLDPRTGVERWAAVVDGTAEVHSRHVWVDEAPGHRTLIDASSGERHELPVEDVTSEPLLELEETAILRATDGLRAVDLTTGQERWRQPAETYSKLIRAGDALIGWSTDAVVAHDAATGQVRWRLPAAASDVVAADGTLVVVDGTDVLAVDEADGRVLWRMEVGPQPAARPNVIGGTVVVARS
jgi:outer membrane protein assembly factor BamB/Zn-dependent protease